MIRKSSTGIQRVVAGKKARMREVVFTKIQNIEYSKAGKKYR